MSFHTNTLIRLSDLTLVRGSHSNYRKLRAVASTLHAIIGTGFITICSDLHAFNIPNGLKGSEPIVTSSWFSMAIGTENGVGIRFNSSQGRSIFWTFT